MVALLAVLTSIVARSFCTSFEIGSGAAVVGHAPICGVASTDVPDARSGTGTEAPAGGARHCDMCPASAPAIVAEPVRTAAEVRYAEASPPPRAMHDALPVHRHLPGISIIRGPPALA